MARSVGTGWQMIIADLSMILFMLTASAVARQDSSAQTKLAPASANRSAAGPAPRSEPVAVWIGGEGAPPLGQWLAQQPRDARQQVTITATYAPGAMQEALAQAQVLAKDAGEARILVEPGSPGMRVVIGYDAPESSLAQGVHGKVDVAKSKDRP
jgi:hypothetical protein